MCDCFGSCENAFSVNSDQRRVARPVGRVPCQVKRSLTLGWLHAEPMQICIHTLHFAYGTSHTCLLLRAYAVSRVSRSVASRVWQNRNAMGQVNTVVCGFRFMLTEIDAKNPLNDNCHRTWASTETENNQATPGPITHWCANRQS